MNERKKERYILDRKIEKDNPKKEEKETITEEQCETSTNILRVN